MTTARLSRASLTFADVELSEFSAPPSGWFSDLVRYFPPTHRLSFSFPPFSLSPRGEVLEASKLQRGRGQSLWAHSQFLFLFCTAAANLNPNLFLYFFSATGFLPVLRRCLPERRPAMRSCDSGMKREREASQISRHSAAALPHRRGIVIADYFATWRALLCRRHSGELPRLLIIPCRNKLR